MRQPSPNTPSLQELKRAKKLAMRLEIAILSAEKRSPSQISKQLKVSRPTVYLWQQRFQEKGLKGIYQDLPRRGRKPSISEEQEKAIISKAKQLKADPAACHKITTLARAVGIEYGATRRVLQRNHLLQIHLKKEPKDRKLNYDKNKKTTASISPKMQARTTYKQLIHSASEANARPITQREIGKQLGFSQSTVSLALSSSRIPNKETRLKIQKTAKEYNYAPTPSSISLANLRWHQKSRSTNIALLIPKRKEDQALYHNLQKQIRDRGYALELIELNEQTTWNALNRRLCQQGIQGIILGKKINQATCLKLKESIQWERFTGLALTPEANWLHSVTGDNNFDRIKQAIPQALNLGHNSFALLDLSKTKANQISQSSWNPFNISLQIHPQHVTHNPSASKLPPLIFQYQNQREQIAQLSAYLHRHKPDAILGDQDACYPLLKEACRGLPQPAFISLRKQDEEDKQIAGLMLHQRKDEIKLIIDCIDRQIRTNEWGLPTYPIHHNNTTNLWRDGFSFPHKSEPATQAKNTNSTRPKNNGQRKFETLNLQKIFNRSTQIRGQWMGAGILPLDTGKQRINHVPFAITPGNKPNQPNCLIMQSSIAQAKDKLPQQVTLPLSGHCKGSHILHTCGWVALSSVFASYKFIYADDTECVIPLRSYGLKPSNLEEITNTSPTSKHALKAKPNTGDWRAHYEINPKQLQKDTHFFKGSFQQIDNRINSYYLFTLHWKNPHPDKPLKALQIESDITQKTTLALLAVTLEK